MLYDFCVIIADWYTNEVRRYFIVRSEHSSIYDFVTRINIIMEQYGIKLEGYDAIYWMYLEDHPPYLKSYSFRRCENSELKKGALFVPRKIK